MKEYTYPSNSPDLTFTYSHEAYEEMHTHDFWEFMLIIEGPILHRINNLEHKLCKNTLCVIRPQDRHAIFLPPKGTAIHFNIRIRESLMIKQLELIDKSLYARLLQGDCIEIIVPPNIVQYTIDTVYQLYAIQQSDPLYDHLLKLVFLDLLRIVLRYFLVPPTTAQYIRPIQELLEIMFDIKNISLSIQEICDLTHYSHSYLIKMFKKHLGTTPMAYFQEIKMHHARQQLETSVTPIPLIAASIGLSNVKYFYTAFKRTFGVSPGEYRKSWKQYYDSFISV